MKAAAILNDGFITRVGCGNISLWYERWLHKGRLCDRLPFVHISDTNLQICDVVQSGIWNFNILATQIPVDIKLEMQSIILNNTYANLLIGKLILQALTSPKVLICGFWIRMIIGCHMTLIGYGFGSYRLLKI